MRKDDFKDIFNPVYIKSVKKIIKKSGVCTSVWCSKCPFSSYNANDNKHCEKYRDIDDTTFADTKLFESAKAFKKMVEEEKEKQFLEDLNKKIEIKYPGSIEELSVIRFNKYEGIPDKKLKVLMTKNQYEKLKEEALKNAPNLFGYREAMKKIEYTKILGMEFEVIEEEKVKKDFKVGDRVKVIADNELKGKTGELRHINNHSAIVKFDDTIDNTTILFRNLEKIEGKQKKEPFELKEGIKFKSIYGEFTFKNYDLDIETNEKFAESTNGAIVYLKNIDWEATRKLNEVKEEPKGDEKLNKDLEKFVIDLIEDKVIEKVILKEYGIKNPAKVKKLTNRGYMDFEKPLDCRKIRQGKNLMFGCGTSFLDLEKTLEINEIQYVIEQPKEEIKEEPKKSITIELNLNDQQELLKRTKKALDYLNNCIEEIEKDYLLKDKIKIKVEIESVE